MNEEILNKLHTALYHISPLASDRDRIILEMGDVIWLESLEKMIPVLPEEVRIEVVAYINEEDVNKAIEIFEKNNIDIETVLTEVSEKVLKDVMDTSL
ncbi:MAG: hypothetical protein KBC41_02165 [Candidatus Pacebacteria bacterium]|nr:hypothetical protein [Candidatus Paceibacterota bacterium]MBP9866860.1 hypothetical protein [Candidatus Paceibacterota bacterium]